jgi:hypothetical protein
MIEICPKEDQVFFCDSLGNGEKFMTLEQKSAPGLTRPTMNLHPNITRDSGHPRF